MIEITNIGKQFGGVQALTDISLTIRRGTVHAFVGENGAGKSTLGKIISGIHAPDLGEMFVNGERVLFSSPRDALARGISTIQQEISLVPRRTVLDNVYLGREHRRFGLTRTGSMLAAYEALDRYTGFGIDPKAIVSDLRLADQQKVEILCAISRNADLIVFDEPTAALTPVESKSLLKVISSLRDAGTTIIFVSHFLREVLDIADDITILRNGRLISSGPAASETEASLVTAMLGRSQEQVIPRDTATAEHHGRGVLEVKELSRGGVLDNVSFTARPGEILGIAGLVGSGRTELLRALFGADRTSGGSISLDGRRLRVSSTTRAIRAGIAMVPESRKEQGLFLARRSDENVSVSSLRRVSRFGFVSKRRERKLFVEFSEALSIRPANAGPVPAGLLSGGNQQKVLIAKWLATKPRVLLVDEPTRGVDIGARFSIYEALARLAAQGMILIVVSSELEEILAIADRVLVMRHGRLVLDAPIDEVSEESVMHAAFGTREVADTNRKEA